MNVIFFGYRKWSYQILKNLLRENDKQWKIVTAITIPKPEANFSALQIPCLKVNPKTLDKEIATLEKYTPEIFLFYGWSWMIPPSLYKSHLCLCLHTSPLPKYRGGSPLQHQIIRGEKTSAVSIFRMVKELDAGDIYGQKTFSLNGTINNIFDRIVKTGSEETIKVLDGLVKNELKPIRQNELHATFYKRRKAEESELTIEDFRTKTAQELYNFIRSLGDPYPNAFIKCKNGKKLFFKKVSIEKI
ncbi:MAG: formyltransferase family protein [Candidatus Levyibacteriota bacterium]